MDLRRNRSRDRDGFQSYIILFDDNHVIAILLHNNCGNVFIIISNKWVIKSSDGWMIQDRVSFTSHSLTQLLFSFLCFPASLLDLAIGLENLEQVLQGHQIFEESLLSARETIIVGVQDLCLFLLQTSEQHLGPEVTQGRLITEEQLGLGDDCVPDLVPPLLELSHLLLQIFNFIVYIILLFRYFIFFDRFWCCTCLFNSYFRRIFIIFNLCFFCFVCNKLLGGDTNSVV